MSFWAILCPANVIEVIVTKHEDKPAEKPADTITKEIPTFDLSKHTEGSGGGGGGSDPHKEFDHNATDGPGGPLHHGNPIADLFSDHKDHGDGFVEETTDKEGHKVRKEVHSGPGWKSVEIHSDGPMNMPDLGGFIGHMLQ